jgi:hydrogenase/urease accessory protein HupE
LRPGGARLGVLLVWFLCPFALAHDARPVAVTITETLPGIFQAVLRVPPTVEGGNIPALVWPVGCEAVAVGPARPVRCEGGLAGRTLSLAYPAFNPSLGTYYHLTAASGQELAAMLAPTEVLWTVPASMTAADVARDYLLLGIEHIIGGLDHLLFVLGLLVIARTPRRILLTVTGFTLAHSLTLSLASLGLLTIAIVPVEAAIALSILFLAHEISQQRRASLTWRFPLLVAFGFGLLHGLGFASALGEIGLVREEVLVSLLFFNLGVEAGQILFIAAVLLLVFTLRSLPLPRAAISSAGVLSPRTDLLAAYVIGVPSAYWLIERLAGFLL